MNLRTIRRWFALKSVLIALIILTVDHMAVRIVLAIGVLVVLAVAWRLAYDVQKRNAQADAYEEAANFLAEIQPAFSTYQQRDQELLELPARRLYESQEL